MCKISSGDNSWSFSSSSFGDCSRRSCENSFRSLCRFIDFMDLGILRKSPAGNFYLSKTSSTPLFIYGDLPLRNSSVNFTGVPLEISSKDLLVYSTESYFQQSFGNISGVPPGVSCVVILKIFFKVFPKILLEFLWKKDMNHPRAENLSNKDI